MELHEQPTVTGGSSTSPSAVGWSPVQEHFDNLYRTKTLSSVLFPTSDSAADKFFREHFTVVAVAV